MSLIERFLKDELFIDFGSEVIYGFDQMYVDFPLRFATVAFQLMATSGLTQIADRIRKDAGMVPLHPMDEYTDATCDRDGWYDFYIGISDIDGGKADAGIEAVVVNAGSWDNEGSYTIDLDGNEQEAVYARLDEQCRQYLGKGCADLLKEARQKMEEDMS